MEDLLPTLRYIIYYGISSGSSRNDSAVAVTVSYLDHVPEYQWRYAALFERVIPSMGNVDLSQTEEEIMLYVTLLKSYVSYFCKFSQYMNSYVSGPTTYSHF